jgi:hypothetical protein
MCPAGMMCGCTLFWLLIGLVKCLPSPNETGCQLQCEWLMHHTKKVEKRRKNKKVYYIIDHCSITFEDQR